MKTISLKKVIPLLFLLTILFSTQQMFQIIFPYTSWKWDVDFLITKQGIIHLDYYRAAFYAHIFSSLVLLFCGAFLFSSFVLKKHPTLHRWLGKIYVCLLLLIAAPSGMVMAYHANGGWMVQVSFFILTPLWWVFTWKGFQTALQKDFRAHRIWMMRSYALTLSAISLRVYQMLLGTFFYMDVELQYILVSWISWLGNLIVVEVFFTQKIKKVREQSSSRTHLLTKIELKNL